MNKLLRKLLGLKAEELSDEQKVIDLSNQLKQALGMDEETFNEIDECAMEVGTYLIIKECRCFKRGWVDLLEITTDDAPSPGYSNVNNPYWLTVQGTKTVNLPPDTVVQDVLNIIKSNE